MDIILRDEEYYRSSRGGVTVSGGEPLLHSQFVAGLLERCHENQIHTCLESTFLYGLEGDRKGSAPYGPGDYRSQAYGCPDSRAAYRNFQRKDSGKLKKIVSAGKRTDNSYSGDPGSQ